MSYSPGLRSWPQSAARSAPRAVFERLSVFVGAFAHRVMVAGRVDTAAAREVLAWLLAQVPVPRP